MGKENSGLGKPYRLSLVEDESHKRIRSWRFTRLGGIVGAVTAVVVSFLLLFALIALTPLKSWVPGYPDAHFKRDAIANAIKIDSLENEMFRWSLYAENLSRVPTASSPPAPAGISANFRKGNSREGIRSFALKCRMPSRPRHRTVQAGSCP